MAGTNLPVPDQKQNTLDWTVCEQVIHRLIHIPGVFVDNLA
jgi:hypothetical protein